MLKDITIGQYFPGDSILHRLDPRCKLALVFLFMIALFMSYALLPYLLLGAFTAAVVLLSKINLKMIVKSLRPLVFIIVFVSIFNLFYSHGTPVFSGLWILDKITYEGIYTTLAMVTRIILLIITSSMLTYTTSPIVLTDGIEQLCAPLKKIGMPVHEFALMMTIALRFIPILIDETDKIINAQKARGADFESGRLLARIKALIPVLVPLLVSAFRRADELSIAMESRCYRGGEGRTKLHLLKSTRRDKAIFFGTCLFFALVVAVNYVRL